MTAIAVLALPLAAVRAGEEAAVLRTVLWAISISLAGALVVLWWLRKSAWEARANEPERILDALLYAILFTILSICILYIITF
jgi:hypothetical protein